ncbi:IS66 family insertion sequence element accessory protein TnpB [Nguyenibacter vanlangensis]|uniref:IS66 family insertion sequence element accessory protein TnpB n=3 Tax=Acetobacteraceae TaxID=433 RepID=A0ABZ3D0S1_9PROT|nr:IS66 family insertion sequence element accessory protein TnpB [Kozakia baliensis]AOX16730.1 hypothetical protein A0U89_05850 [Kozakia baliensis]AOX16893.1 hypothetical protein A0U89_06830 [Kozakia baliensis]AOX18805.1 hypothetical protein A0U89_16040 [Kozakia baliensis]GBR29371.1 transposase [Kozakia baliensis NRIC 0488]GEL65752.1 transposase [Kozakia baliensis]
MIWPSGEVRIWLACGVTDMRRGINSLALQVQTTLGRDPHDGSIYIFRGRKGDTIKVLFWDRQGMCLAMKRLESGKFVWPQAKDGSVSLTTGQMAMLVEAIDWRATAWTARPQVVG